MAVVLWQNIVYSNGAYLYKKLQYDAVLSSMTQVDYQINCVEEYELGVTPLLLVGDPTETLCGMDRPGFEPYYEINGMRSFIHATSLTRYYEWVLGRPVNYLTDAEQIAALEASPEVAAMPAFPKNGCCQMVDGVMVIKVSE